MKNLKKILTIAGLLILVGCGKQIDSESLERCINDQDCKELNLETEAETNDEQDERLEDLESVSTTRYHFGWERCVPVIGEYNCSDQGGDVFESEAGDTISIGSYNYAYHWKNGAGNQVYFRRTIRTDWGNKGTHYADIEFVQINKNKNVRKFERRRSFRSYGLFGNFSSWITIEETKASGVLSINPTDQEFEIEWNDSDSTIELLNLL